MVMMMWIDYWIIGVDDANTDSSPQVIMKHLGHIPGKIVTVLSSSPSFIIIITSNQSSCWLVG